MRMKFWIIISILIHLIFALGISFKFSPGSKKYIDLSYLTITDFKEKEETTKEVKINIKKEGEIKAITEKISEETNEVQQKEEAKPIFQQDKFMPFYLVEELPVPLTKISPPYPEEAKRLGIEGIVVAKLYIDENGFVEEVEVIKSPNELLSIASKKALKEIRFKPAKASGKNVPVCIELTLRFKLTG